MPTHRVKAPAGQESEFLPCLPTPMTGAHLHMTVLSVDQSRSWTTPAQHGVWGCLGLEGSLVFWILLLHCGKGSYPSQWGWPLGPDMMMWEGGFLTGHSSSWPQVPKQAAVQITFKGTNPRHIDFSWQRFPERDMISPLKLVSILSTQDTWAELRGWTPRFFWGHFVYFFSSLGRGKEPWNILTALQSPASLVSPTSAHIFFQMYWGTSPSLVTQSRANFSTKNANFLPTFAQLAFPWCTPYNGPLSSELGGDNAR
jgi:hypothetical protein